MGLLFFTQVLLPLLVAAVGCLVAWYGFRYTLGIVEDRVKDAGAYLFGILVGLAFWFSAGVAVAVGVYNGFMHVAFC